MKAEEMCCECMERLTRQAVDMAVEDWGLWADVFAAGMKTLHDNFPTEETTIAISTKFIRLSEFCVTIPLILVGEAC